ncbi:MAG TPA: hypothetical protein VFZ26_03835 [Gemmatimonadales bacterium]
MRTRTSAIVAEGLVAGLLAHLAIALVLIVGDLAAGRALFYSPMLLASAVLEGGAQGCQVATGATLLLAYTSMHLVALTGMGIVGSWLVHASEEHPGLWFGALMAFVFVAWHLSAAVLGFMGPVQGCVSLWPVTVAGFAGALAMAGYLWRGHPRLRRVLRDEQFA